MNIVLTGFMCAGKTTIGRKLAKLLDFNFIDTDMEIEEDQGCSVEDIFKYGGEECFRDMETKVLEKLKNVQNSVISTGGGIVERTSNRKLLKEESLVVWLRADIEALVKRVSRHSLRPLLKGKDPLEVLTQLDEERASLYEDLADIEIDTSNMKPSNVSELLFDSLKSHLGVENE